MNIFGSLWHEHIRFMSPLGCQYVMRTYWTDASTPAVAAGIVWLYGPKIRKLNPCGGKGERSRHPPVTRREVNTPAYKQGQPKVRPVRVQRPTGSNKKRKHRRVKLSSVQQRRRRFIQRRPPRARCSICREAHLASSCPRLLKADVDERWNMAKKSRVCFKCLKYRKFRHRCNLRPSGLTVVDAPTTRFCTQIKELAKSLRLHITKRRQHLKQ
ncbi:hypothetical protein EVAR_2925_1 [Eumeta japonica]|uniref:Uncharacterized protein n=1 Tax=Eumeta variegata TaxID=151549 RepID=A0A4C1T0W9_EUMVA|nr:hypothetical protein EVAR_2925_1 [Eumeta japonica]